MFYNGNRDRLILIGQSIVLERSIMLTYPIEIAGIKRELPICRVNDSLYIGAFVIFGDVELTIAAAKALLEKAPEYDYMITAESKGIPLVYEMARQSGQNKYLLARKSAKLYMRDVFSVSVKSITTTNVQQLFLDADDAALIKGKRVLVVDDVISTGQSLYAVEELVRAAGGEIAARMAILAEGVARKRDDIIYLEPLPLFKADGTVLE